jgi:hypothetical protein
MNAKLYLSGKITGLPTPSYQEKFKAAQRKYERHGFKVVNPIYIKPLFGRPSWLCYMIADVWQLLSCKTIVMLYDWHDSRGARIELMVAILLRKQIIVDRPVRQIDTIKEIQDATWAGFVEEHKLENRLRRAEI